ncbi:MAG: hypothetical protein HQK79_19420 [Desulfobacterales bacterium]|nr:hypothetical protein [Desulfobacterales bacterium]MBF0396933.1 hypothetical protein [Desulfobacterales bacterium]
MLNTFDFIRIAKSGSELIATIQYLTEKSYILFTNELGPPLSGVVWPCQRCWFYSCLPSYGERHCEACSSILKLESESRKLIRSTFVLWGFVNKIPFPLTPGQKFLDITPTASYVFDEHHFIIILNRSEIKKCLKEIVNIHKLDLVGLIQIFPVKGSSLKGTMADILSHVTYQENRFPMDYLRIRFFSKPYHIFEAREKDKDKILTFEISEFLKILDLPSIFRPLLNL